MTTLCERMKLLLHTFIGCKLVCVCVCVCVINEGHLHMQLVELEVIYHQRSMEALQRIIPQLQQSIGTSLSLYVCMSVCLSLCL